MPEITDRDGDLLKVSPSGSGNAGVHLGASVPWGVDLSPEGAMSLVGEILRLLKKDTPLAREGEIWASREHTGRTVRVLSADTTSVLFEVLTDTEATIAKGARTAVGRQMRVSAGTWSPNSETRGYYKTKEALADG